MFCHLLRVAILCLTFVPLAASAAEPALLSNNVKEGGRDEAFPKETVVIPTEMTAKWITEGEFATDAETVETSKFDSIPTVLFDGQTGSNWKSRTYSKWNSGKWVTLVVDLGAEYALSAFDVWALHEASRDTQSFTVLLSDDGKTFTPQGIATSEDVPQAKDLLNRMRLTLDQPVKSRFIEFRIQRHPSAKQQQISEIAIWGNKVEEGVSYLPSDSRPKVAFTVQTIQSGVVKLDWAQSSKVHPEVKQWNIYRSSKPFASVKEADAKLVAKAPADANHALVYPLKPGESFYLGVTAVYPQGEYPEVASMGVQMPMPFECNTFADMVAINHFWGGGGHRVDRGSAQMAYENVAIDLLGKSGIKQVRWWIVNPDVYRALYERGIGVYAYPAGDNIRAATRLGVNEFAGPKNEPDFTETPIESYVAALAKVDQTLEKENPHALVCAPSSNLDDTSIDWLDRFYQLGGKDKFDVLDLHTYTKVNGGHRVPDGYPAGAPEGLYDNMDRIQAVLTKHGDTDKPMISTEFGYSDAVVNNFSGRITSLVQAQYLVRGLIIHHALGFKRVFLYSFWDEGTDRNDMEQRFGLIDYDLQRKPAYFAVETLLKNIGDCELVGPISNMALPSVGYAYQNKQSNKFVSVIWDGTGDRNGVFTTKAKSITLVDLFGQSKTIQPDAKGHFIVAYGPSAVYLHADHAIEYVSSEKSQIPPSPSVQAE